MMIDIDTRPVIDVTNELPLIMRHSGRLKDTSTDIGDVVYYTAPRTDFKFLIAAAICIGLAGVVAALWAQ